MSMASHAAKRLRELYGAVLLRMRVSSERLAAARHAVLAPCQISTLEQLEPRLLLDGTGPNPHGLYPGEQFQAASRSHGPMMGSCKAVVADFNGDGHADVVTVNAGVSILLGNGDGTITAHAT